jgi:hypothetical protein
VIRTLTLSGLLLAALAVSAAEKDKDEKKDKKASRANTYKTPQEVFDAAVVAMGKKDWAAMVSCFTPEGHKQMAVDLALQGTFMRAQAEGRPVQDKSLKDKDKAEPDDTLLKKYKPVLDVMDKYGLTKAATKGVKVKGFRPSKADREAILKLVKDPAAFAAAFLIAQEKTGDARDKDEPKPTLTEVKIDGD